MATPPRAPDRPRPPARRVFHNGWMLSLAAPMMDDGSFQARVALTALVGEHTRSQCFLDLGRLPTEEEALSRAEEAGRQWVDTHGS